jgi:hypothetical protein
VGTKERIALVTGAPGRLAEVAAALRAGDYAVVEVPAGADTAAVLEAAGSPELDAYVQLPVDVQADAPSVTSQMVALLEQGIVARFRAAASVLPHLAEGAHVVLVPGNLPPDLAAPDDHEARLALLRVLAHALRADRAPGHVAVAVASAQHSPDALARMAGGERVPHPPVPDYAAMWPDMSYDEWRLAVLGLETLEG